MLLLLKAGAAAQVRAALSERVEWSQTNGNRPYRGADMPAGAPAPIPVW
jgi:hypothetical protein